MAILVSRYDHCPIDLLRRWDAGELKAGIPLIVSNHPDRTPRHPLPSSADDEGDEGGAGG